jgi:lipid kinase YegS
MNSGHENSRRIRVILHAKVAQDESVRAAVRSLRDEGARIEVRVTWEPSDSELFTHEAIADEGIATVVAGGGDGTLNAIATALVGVEADRTPTFGVLPLGTANDFARGLGLPAGDPLAALRTVVESEPRAVDLGRCNERFFINVATGGFGTELTVNTRPELKKALGGAAYLLTGIANPQSVTAREGELTGPGFTWRGRFLALAVGNARYAGGGIDLCPGAGIDDGMFDVTVVPAYPESGIPTAMRDLVAGGIEALHGHFVTTRLPWVRVHAPDGVQINLDGEPLRDPDVAFDCLPGALHMHLPYGCALVTGQSS